MIPPVTNDDWNCHGCGAPHPIEFDGPAGGGEATAQSELGLCPACIARLTPRQREERRAALVAHNCERMRRVMARFDAARRADDACRTRTRTRRAA